MVGGPSIVFCQCAEAGKSRIHDHQDQDLCQHHRIQCEFPLPLLLWARDALCNLVPRASVTFPQKASWQADTPGKRCLDLDKFCLFGTNTDALPPFKFTRSHLAGSVEELTVGGKTEFGNGWTVR